MTEKHLNSLREQRMEASLARFRRLYAFGDRPDSAPQLPPPRGHRRPQFCRPLRQVDIRVHGHKLVDPTAWGYENEPVTMPALASDINLTETPNNA
jgi:hypothetical protein